MQKNFNISKKTETIFKSNESRLIEPHIEKMSQMQITQITQITQEFDIDRLMAEDRNKQIKELESEIIELNETMQMVNALIVRDGEKLDIVEDNITKVSQDVEETIIILENTAEQVDGVRNKYTTVKVVSGVVVGGVLLGGIGSIFGIIPAVIGAGIGSGGGGLVGYVSKYFGK